VVLLRLQALTSRVPALLDASGPLWLVPQQMLAARAAFVTAAAASILAARAGLAERATLSGQDLSLLSVQFGRVAAPLR